MLLALDNNRILIKANLKPVQGTRFQPTEFPDLGAGEFQLHDETYSLIVDSPQAVTNHLEQHCLTADGRKFVDALKGLSMIHVEDKDGNYLTNSVLEGHRIASPYILGSSRNRTKVGEEFDSLDKKSNPLADRTKIIDKLFEYDVNSLLHGVWLSRVGEGRIKVPRAVSAFIEADNARSAVYGGVKKDHVTTSTKSSQKSVDGSGSESDSQGQSEERMDASSGIGSIPFARVEYTAERITAYFNIDLAQLRNYGLEYDKVDLLKTLALWKIRQFLESPFRPRTACDLMVDGDIEITPKSFELPSSSDLDSAMKHLIGKCGDSMADTSVVYK